MEDLRTARAVVATGGFSLMGEAVHLGVPMLARPIQGQFEQEMNALYLRQRTGEFEQALRQYPRQPDNGILFRCLGELLEDIREGRPAADHLRTPAMGAYAGDEPD